jgi:hypothetical protein
VNAGKLFKLILLILLPACLLLSGCAYVAIHEDAAQEELPNLDPEEGVARDVSVTLYYRLTGEKYLVGVTRNVAVRANERVESAIIRTLLSGVPPLSNNVTPLFSAGTEIMDVTLDGGILYVTLSAEFLDESALERTKSELRSFYEKNVYDQREYDYRVAQAEARMYLERSLAVYSLVNTLTQYSDNEVRVQFLVDEYNTGGGVRLTRSELGIAAPEDADSELIEPMGFVEDAVATPLSIMDCVLSHMQRGEYELAYPLFAESENDESQKPTYATFETEMLSLGTLVHYEIKNSKLSDDQSYAYVYVDLEFKYADAKESIIQNARFLMKREGDLYKTGYETYKSAFER